MRRCGRCGETGHNRRTCPDPEEIVEAEEEQEEEVVVEKPAPKKKTIRCRLCSEKDDHTAKNCPYKPLPEGIMIGPTRMECGCWSWWQLEGECQLCTRAIFRKHSESEAA